MKEICIRDSRTSLAVPHRQLAISCIVSLAFASLAPSASAQSVQPQPSAPVAPASQGSAGQTTAAQAPANAQANAAADTQSLDRVVVTSTLRPEVEKEVPMEVNLISADKLDKAGAQFLTDYLATQPGVTTTSDGGAGLSAITVRGVSSGDPTSTTVAVYVDNVPFGSSSAFALGSTLSLDLGLLDLNHIELLRGPQGTLYGAGSMGGLLKYITNVPEFNDFSGKVSLGINSTEKGGTGGTEAAVLNIPLSDDVAALRVSAYRQQDSGFIDAVGPASGSNINRGDTTGARVSVLLQPSERLSIRLSATAQSIERDGSDYVDYNDTNGQAVEGRYTRLLSVREPYSSKTGVVAADVEYDFGWATFNSITSVQSSKTTQRNDDTAAYGPLLASVGILTDGVPQDNFVELQKQTQEFRLTSRKGTIEWIAGLFYDHEKAVSDEIVNANGFAGGPLAVVMLPSNYIESAFYGDLTWNPTKQLSLTAGIRHATNNQEFEQSSNGLLVGGASSAFGVSSGTADTYLATARYGLTPDSNIYLRAASGYRPGGPNPILRDSAGNLLGPTQFKSDNLWSYEGGYKADFLNRTVSLDASVYDIHWNQIQEFAAVNGVSVIVNGGKAEITGSDVTLSYHPNSDWTVSGGFSYIDALAKTSVPGLVEAGQRLPNSAKFSAVGSLTHNFILLDHPSYIGLDERYAGERNAGFDGSSTLPNYKLPAYAMTDIHAGMDFGRYQLALFLRNLFNRDAQLSAST